MRTDQFILASQSKQRRSLLEAAGYDFSILPAEIDEYEYRNPDLQVRAVEIATAKLAAVRANNPQATIIAADSFVVLDGKSFEKPTSKSQAIAMISSFSGKTVDHITALCYSDLEKNIFHSEAVVSRSHFRTLAHAEINRYVEHNPVTTWSGGFSPAYDAGACLLTHIDGSLTGCTHGIPMEIVIALLNSSGYEPQFRRSNLTSKSE